MYQISRKATGRAKHGPVRIPDDQPAAPAKVRLRLGVRHLVAGDAAAALVAATVCLGVYAARSPGVPLLVCAVAVVALLTGWICALSVTGCYDRAALDDRAEELRRVLLGAALVLAGVALLGWGWRVDVPRGIVAVVLPLALALTLTQRGVRRRWLRRAHAAGRLQRRTVLVGDPHDVALVHRLLRREPAGEYRVIGCCLPATEGSVRTHRGLPVLGRTEDVAAVVRRHAINTVTVFPSAALDGYELRRIGQELRGTQTELLVTPAVPPAVGSRMVIRRVYGLPLVQLDHSELHGAGGLVKSAFDRIGAALALFLVAPVFGALALAVKATSRGPVLVRHERVGRAGRTFGMLMFRTSREPASPGADEATDEAREAEECTRVGRLLRRHCLDHLPELINVLSGDMSLVGPRPRRPGQAEHLGVRGPRGPVVKPGLTGLGPDRGGFPDSREEAPSLDVVYADTWSLVGDLRVLWRAGRGAVRGPRTS
jgi:lipopolysaccharide/colanic/teichoic acid biosynthesis glycosyltransferase